jgi:hypothetical protein
MGKPTTSRNASATGPGGRVRGRWRPRSALGGTGTRGSAGVRRSVWVSAGSLRRRRQRPSDRGGAGGGRLAGAGGAVATASAAGASPAAAGSPAAALHRGAHRRPRGRAGLHRRARHLADRVMERGWLLAEVAAELGTHRLTVQRLLDRHGIRRVRRTTAERAASESGRRVQQVGWQARRAGRLAELGFGDLAAYLQARHVEQGWSVKRMRAELRVGRRWLVGSWPGWGCDSDLKARPPGCWPNVGPQRCCEKVSLWAFLPGFTGSKPGQGPNNWDWGARPATSIRADRRWP